MSCSKGALGGRNAHRTIRRGRFYTALRAGRRTLFGHRPPDIRYLRSSPFAQRHFAGGSLPPVRQRADLEKRWAQPRLPRLQIATSNVEDREAAEKELKGLIELVNRTWERRAEIAPDYETHQRPTPMAIYKLLPQTNCKQCGEPTCFTFAIKLAAAQVKLSGCAPVFEPQYERNLAELEGIVIDAPAIG
jgi:hypothetical protein